MKVIALILCCSAWSSSFCLPIRSSHTLAIGARGGDRKAIQSAETPPSPTFGQLDPKPDPSGLFSRLDASVALKALSLTLATVSSVAVFSDQRVMHYFQNLSPIHKYFPFARHQVLIVAAWLFNNLAIKIPGRSDGRSWKTSSNIRFFTPAAWAFSIWAPIYAGEFLLVIYQLFSKQLSPGIRPFMAELSPSFALAFVTQSLWCFVFRPWVGNWQLLPTATLALTGLGLARVHKVMRIAVAVQALKPWDFFIVHLPLSLHFAWILCAALVNFNGWLSVTPFFRTGDKLGLALLSMNMAGFIGSQVGLDSGDPVIPLVIAWALWGIGHDCQEGISAYRRSKVVSEEAMDCMEVSAKITAMGQAALGVGILGLKLLILGHFVKAGQVSQIVAGLRHRVAQFLS